MTDTKSLTTDTSLVERLRERSRSMHGGKGYTSALLIEAADRLEALSAPVEGLEEANKLRDAADRLDQTFDPSFGQHFRDAADVIDRVTALLAVEKERADAAEHDLRRSNAARIRTEARAEKAEARAERLEAALRPALLGLKAATSLIKTAHERHQEPRLAVASDKIFDQMIEDYERRFAEARAVLNPEPKP